VSVQPGDLQGMRGARSGRSQPESAARQAGTAVHAEQHGQANGVAVIDTGKVDDEPMRATPKMGEEALAQRSSGCGAELQPDGHRRAVVQLSGGGLWMVYQGSPIPWAA
jgi:hypothetical protein